MLSKIVSGGQTGVDRGALDAALAADFPCGGWCPEGRKAEDGVIPERYPVIVLPGAGYRERTRQNVVDSDATLVFCSGPPSGGTRETLRLCESHKKPALTIDGSKTPFDSAVTEAIRFIEAHRIQVLNVAGPRESGCSGARHYARGVVSGIIAGRIDFG